jgi:hypothetical protein
MQADELDERNPDGRVAWMRILTDQRT